MGQVKNLLQAVLILGSSKYLTMVTLTNAYYYYDVNNIYHLGGASWGDASVPQSSNWGYYTIAISRDGSYLAALCEDMKIYISSTGYRSYYYFITIFLTYYHPRRK